MKTTKNTFLKVLGMVALTLTLVSCGKDNNSGGNDYGWGGVGVQNLGASGQQYITSIVNQQAQSCSSQGGQVRQFTQQVNVNGSGVAIGVTSNGGVAVLDGSSRTLTMRLCDTPSNPFVGQPQIVSGGSLTALCNGIYVLNGLTVQIAVQGTQMTGQPFVFVFRNPYSQPNCNYNNGNYNYGY